MIAATYLLPGQESQGISDYRTKYQKHIHISQKVRMQGNKTSTYQFIDADHQHTLICFTFFILNVAVR